VADEGDEVLFRQLLGWKAGAHPTNTPGEFVAMCGAIGLGRLIAEGQTELSGELRALARDPRWRVREGVAFALQRWGAADIEGVLRALDSWLAGTHLERRAVIAGLCEPALLATPEVCCRVLRILEAVTESIVAAEDRRSDPFRVLRQALGYCWSVAIAACPEPGKLAFSSWLSSPDRDVRWIVRQNLRKKRLVSVDPEWVRQVLEELDPPTPD
jgi:hypothetical protein